jgi:hypothetical protein
MLWGTRALDAWLGDRGGLIRGTAAWDRRLPDAVTRALAGRAPSLPALVELLSALLARAQPSGPLRPRRARAWHRSDE